MTLTDVVFKIIGPVIPAGNTELDEWRYNNLKEMLNLTSDLLDRIHKVAIYETSNEQSVNKIGKAARRFLVETKEIL